MTFSDYMTNWKFTFSGTDIDLVRAKLNADEQMCWYVKNTYGLLHYHIFFLLYMSYEMKLVGWSFVAVNNLIFESRFS